MFLGKRKIGMEQCPFRFGDPWGNRTPVIAVKGRCLNLLTNGPNVVAASGLEPPTVRV